MPGWDRMPPLKTRLAERRLLRGHGDSVSADDEAQHLPPLAPLLAGRPDVLSEVAARLRETASLIAWMTVEDAAAYPNRTDHDWPHLDCIGLDATDVQAAQTVRSGVLTAVERRVQAGLCGGSTTRIGSGDSTGV
jgi:hypothetical protein